jgi:hypothetical protein
MNPPTMALLPTPIAIVTTRAREIPGVLANALIELRILKRALANIIRLGKAVVRARRHGTRGDPVTECTFETNDHETNRKNRKRLIERCYEFAMSFYANVFGFDQARPATNIARVTAFAGC